MADELALRADSEFWPFTNWAPEKKVEAPVVVEAPRKQVSDAKQILLASSVFQQKTADLCKTATEAIMQDCENAASERLFCSMFTRHEDKFKGNDSPLAANQMRKIQTASGRKTAGKLQPP